MKDKSILIFDETGKVEMYASTEWKAPRKKKGLCHTFLMNDKEQAIRVFEILETKYL